MVVLGMGEERMMKTLEDGSDIEMAYL